MSHEGIRLVSEEQSRKEKEAERELPHDAVTPTKVRVHKTDGRGMEIDWKDGHHSAWTFAWLRNGCPCATCNEERKATGRDQPSDCPSSDGIGPKNALAPSRAIVALRWPRRGEKSCWIRRP